MGAGGWGLEAGAEPGELGFRPNLRPPFIASLREISYYQWPGY